MIGGRARSAKGAAASGMAGDSPPVSLPAMLHLVLHVALPALVALACYRPRWRGAALIMLATMAVDVDHLLADPVYDPQRCSVGFHPLHTLPAVALYAALAALPLLPRRKPLGPAPRRLVRVAHLIGVGLLIHMALDGGDCLL